jgi:RND family efflux transporter MFP subunit
MSREPELQATEAAQAPPRSSAVPAVLVGLVGLILTTGAVMIRRAEGRVNKVALASSPQPVSVVATQSAQYRESRTYGAMFAPWVQAQVGPQFVSAYVDSVLVRPGVVVKRGDVLAILDCRNASETAKAVELEARAIETEQKAIADEAAREQKLLPKSFVSPDEVERELARSSEQEARLASQKAQLAKMALSVSDCSLRAPFDGEIATRDMDPGAFARPGSTVVSVVDRSTLRLSADAPETDFDLLAPGSTVQVHVLALDENVTGTISRRSPGTDLTTRTVHFEVDVPNPQHRIPANTTGEIRVESPSVVPATKLPVYAASIVGDTANVFVVDGGVARKRSAHVIGEVGPDLYVDPRALPAGVPVIAEGRDLLDEGDPVAPKPLEQPRAAAGHAASP